MKKGLVSLFIIVGVCLFLQQRTPSIQAQYDDTSSCNNNNERQWGNAYLDSNSPPFNQQNIDKCIADQNNSEDWCCVCFEDNAPDVCDQLYSVLSGTPQPTAIPTNTPTPTPTPTPLPVNCTLSAWGACSAPCGMGVQTRTIVSPALYGGTCYGPFQQSCFIVQHCPVDCVWSAWSPCSKSCDQGIQTRTIQTQAAYGGKECTGATQTTCFIQSCSAIGTTGGFITGATGATNNELQIYLNSYTSSTTSSTKVLLPTYTPIPTKAPSPTMTPFPSPTPKTDNEPSAPFPTSTPYIRPTNVPLPTPTKYIPVPTERLIPPALTTKTETTKDKTTSLLDIKSLTEIKIIPNTPSKVTPTDRPFLSQEQRQLAVEAPTAVAGLLVTLEQKIGKAFVTQQDELLVKRGNQFFSISNQSAHTPSQTNENGQSNTSLSKTPPAQLEINANNVIARSSMGLSVDPLSGILTVETPSGPQKVSIMPDEALGIVLELKALNSKGVVEPSILLVSEKGALIYRISGAKVEKFLGLFPLPVQKQIIISADTGSVVKVELSLISQIISFFTF